MTVKTIEIGDKVRILDAEPQCLQGLTGTVTSAEDPGLRRVRLDDTPEQRAAVGLEAVPDREDWFSSWPVYVDEWELVSDVDTSAREEEVKSFTQSDVDDAVKAEARRVAHEWASKLEAQRVEFDEWKTRAVESLMEDADRHDYCTEAEEALARAGFEVWQERTFRVTATVERTYTLRVSPRGKTDEGDDIDDIDWESRLVNDLYEMRSYKVRESLSDVDVDEDND